jgi:hypothetical protein
MTEPLSSQEYASVANARLLLQRLSDCRLTPRIPLEIRREAMALLRRFPRPERLAELSQSETLPG